VGLKRYYCKRKVREETTKGCTEHWPAGATSRSAWREGEFTGPSTSRTCVEGVGGQREINESEEQVGALVREPSGDEGQGEEVGEAAAV